VQTHTCFAWPCTIHISNGDERKLLVCQIISFDLGGLRNPTCLLIQIIFSSQSPKKRPTFKILRTKGFIGVIFFFTSITKANLKNQWNLHTTSLSERYHSSFRISVDPFMMVIRRDPSRWTFGNAGMEHLLLNSSATICFQM